MDFMDILDVEMDELLAKIDLLGKVCQLNHSIEDPPEAVDYLCQYIGKQDDPGIEPMLLRIPICEECVRALYDEDWLLFYCLTCNSSAWLLKSKAKKLYPKWESVKFFHTCPNCDQCPVHT